MHMRFIYVLGLLSIYGIVSIFQEQQNLVLRRTLSQQHFRLDTLENQVLQAHVELNIHLSPSQLEDTEITPLPLDPAGDFIDE